MMGRGAVRHLTFCIKARSDLLIGGHSEAPTFADAGTASYRGEDERRTPCIPGSALKGALREAVVWLVRGKALQGGAERACEPTDPCAASEAACVVCRIFGRPGFDRPEHVGAEEQDPALGSGAEGGLFVEDGRLKASGGGEELLALRHGVSIDRKTETRREGLLYLREVGQVRGHTFEARAVAWLDEADLETLKQACMLVAEVGNSRSRGLGWLDVEVREESGAPGGGREAITIEGEPESGIVQVELEGPGHFGDFPDASNFQATLPFIPGSTLQGGVLAALLREGLIEARDEDFMALYEGLSFSDLWPAPPQGQSDGVSAPLPRTMLSCREHGEQRVDRILAQALVGELLRQRGGSPAEPLECRKCGKPLRPASGLVDLAADANSSRQRLKGARHEVVTRLSIDPKTRSFAPGMLYSREQIAAGTRFVGTFSGLDARGQALLKKLKTPLRLGGMRSRGLGCAHATLRAAASEHLGARPLEERLKKFQYDADKHAPPELLAALGLPVGGRWVQVVARTPLGLPDGVTPDKAGEWLAQELGFRAGCPKWSFVRTEERSGWDQLRTAERAIPTRRVLGLIASGSTWLFLVDDPAKVSSATLNDAEIAGVGALEHRRLGLGRLVICPELRRTPPA